MPYWSIEEWRVRIACSYLALGIWRPIKLRGYGGRIKSKPFISSYPTQQFLSLFVTWFKGKFLSTGLVQSLVIFIFLDLNNALSDLLTPPNVWRLCKKPSVYRKINQLVVLSLKFVMVTLSYFKLQLLLSGDVETNPGPDQLTLSDVDLIVRNLRVASCRWFEIGLALQLSKEDLHLVRVREHFSFDRYTSSLRGMISLWLHPGGNSLPPTWSVLVEALKTPDVDLEWLAVKIEHNYVSETVTPVKDHCSNYSAILDEALKNGYVLLHITKVVVCGSAGNGKTHTKYVLFNEHHKLSLIRKSTPLFDDPIVALSREVVGTDETGCEWFKLTYDELNKMLAQSINEENVVMKEAPQASAESISEETPETLNKASAQMTAEKGVQSDSESVFSKVEESDELRPLIQKHVIPYHSSTQSSGQAYDSNINLGGVQADSNSSESEKLPVHAIKKSTVQTSPNEQLSSNKTVEDIDEQSGLSSEFIHFPGASQKNNLTSQHQSSEQCDRPFSAVAYVTSKLKRSASRQELLRKMETRTRSNPLLLHWIHFIDSGGQPQFHELLQAFIKKTSVVMIVLKLSESLDSYPEIAYHDRKTGKKCGESYKSSLRNDQIIQRCVRTLSKDKQSRVLIVGTHLDRIHESQDTIKDKNEKLLKMLKPAIGAKLVTRSDDSDVIFPLNALNPGNSDKRVAASIRGEIAKDKQLLTPYKVPIAWFLLEQDMQKLEKSVISVQECYELGTILYMNETTVDAALDYFHELNIILYYPSILQNVIFVSPQVIVDKVTELIEYSFYCRDKPESEVNGSIITDSENWKDFIDHGRISEDILSDQKFSKHYVPQLLTPRDLILVFQHLFIVAPISDTAYFMPSLLAEIVPEELNEYRPTTEFNSPVLVYFPDGCCPGGSFCCLCVYLISECGWKTEGRLFRNCLKFSLEEENCEVIVIDAFQYFEVYLNAPPYIALDISSTILHQVKSGLKEAATTLLQEEIRYHFAVLCPSGEESNCDSSPHAAVVSNTGQYWTCCKDSRFTGELDKQQAAWFSQTQQLESLKNEIQELKELQLEKDEQIEQLEKLQLEKDSLIQDLQERLHDKEISQCHQEKAPTLSLPSAELVSKGRLTIQRSDEYQTLEWKNHGLKIHIPPGALPDSDDTCDIIVATSFSGNFVIPQGHTLVSALYYIQPSTELAKPVTLEIEHYCSIKSDDEKSIVPIHAQTTSKSSTYVFQPLTGGCTLSSGSFWASFEVNKFSWYGLSWIKSVLSWFGSYKQEEEVPGPPAVYKGQVYYCLKDCRNCLFNVKLIVFPNLMEYTQAVEKLCKSQKKWHEMGSSFHTEFLPKSNTLTIPIDENGIEKDGWIISPCRVPLRIKREHILKPVSMDSIANCELSVLWTEDDTEPRNLLYHVAMEGIDIKSFLISLSPNSLTLNNEIIELQSPSKVVTQSDLKHLVNILRSIPTRNNFDLGTQLNIPDYIIMDFERSNSHDSERVRIEMLNYWLQNTERVSWDDIAEAVTNIGFNNVASKIIEYAA